MIRLAWRQSRLPAIATLVLVTSIAAILLVTGFQMSAYLTSSGLARCLSGGGDCTIAANEFTGKYGSLLGDIAWLSVAPMLAGLFWGAPLVAREVEQHTHHLVWTQSVSRPRWLLSKLSLYLIGVVAVSILLTLLFTWWYQPFARIDAGGAGESFSRMNLNVFDFQGTVLIGYTLFAFALGTTAGAMIQRVIPAMVVTIAGFVTIRLLFQSLRSHFLPPLTSTNAFAAADPRAALGDWTLSSGPVNSSGQPLTFGDLVSTCSAKTGSGIDRACVAAHGIVNQDVYQPLSRFWTFQGIETGSFVAISIAILVLGVWWTVRRIH